MHLKWAAFLWLFGLMWICERSGGGTFVSLFVDLSRRRVGFERPVTRRCLASKALRLQSDGTVPFDKLELQQPSRSPTDVQRRLVAAGVMAGLSMIGRPSPAAAESSAGLRALLARRDLLELKSPIFNIPPSEQKFPDWLEGRWLVEQRFLGFAFPTLAKDVVGGETDVAGFKVCSIIDYADVGKPSVNYEVRWVRERGGVVEDLPSNIASSVGAHLPGKIGVTRVDYMPEKDANRWSTFITGSRNAERVEVFVNSRNSELAENNPDLFLTSEYRRQVTFSSRVVQGYSGNYQHFKIFRRLNNDHVRLNVITASYLDPLSPLYFQTTDKPVVVFRHEANLTRSTNFSSTAAA